MRNFKKIDILQKTVYCDPYVVLYTIIFSCAYVLHTYEEKIEIQTTEMYNEHNKILKTYFLY